MSAWRELQQAAVQKKTRPFFRAVDKHGRMYAGMYCFFLNDSDDLISR